MAKQSNISIDQGTDITFDLTVTDENGDLLNLSDCTARAQLRKHYTSNTVIDFTTSCNVSTSIITLTLTANQTSNVDAGRYVYDVDIINDGAVFRVIEGIATIRPMVTR